MHTSLLWPMYTVIFSLFFYFLQIIFHTTSKHPTYLQFETLLITIHMWGGGHMCMWCHWPRKRQALICYIGIHYVTSDHCRPTSNKMPHFGHSWLKIQPLNKAGKGRVWEVPGQPLDIFVRQLLERSQSVRSTNLSPCYIANHTVFWKKPKTMLLKLLYRWWIGDLP